MQVLTPVLIFQQEQATLETAHVILHRLLLYCRSLLIGQAELQLKIQTYVMVPCRTLLFSAGAFAHRFSLGNHQYDALMTRVQTVDTSTTENLTVN